MSTVFGNDGTVDIAGNAMGEGQSFSINMSGDTVETSVMGNSNKTFIAGKTEWDFIIDTLWDPDDTTGQEVAVAGSSVAMILAPEGDGTSGDVSYVGTGIITGVEISTTHDDMVKRTISGKGAGALTTTTTP